MNEFFVGVQGESVVILRPVPARLTRDQALSLAACLLVMSMSSKEVFDRKYEEIKAS